MREIIDHIGGLPFIDTGFRPEKLVGLAAYRRITVAETFGKSLDDPLSPTSARSVYADQAITTGLDVPLEHLDVARRDVIEQVERAVMQACPSWRALLALPVDYFLLPRGYVSLTCGFMPQTVFLGESAFRSRFSLREAFLHEHAHVWMDLLLEVADFQYPASGTKYRLPSGTGGKTATGVILAAHFAASCCGFYRRLDCGDALARAGALRVYAREAVASIASAPELTPLGCRIREHLKEALNALPVDAVPFP